MKSIKYILINLALFGFMKSFACGYPTYTPGEYFVFYAYEENEEDSNRPQSMEVNIQDWEKHISYQATYDDIWHVVYNYAIEDLKNIENRNFNAESKLSKNTFVKYLIEKQDTAIIKLLLLAKRCEISRAKRTDKWWYPTKEELHCTDLQSILDEALAYQGSVLKSRYLLQAIRAAYTLNNYDLCLQIWNEQVKNQPSSAVKSMCEDYIGGIYFQQGDYETAIIHYANTIQTSNSFWWCLNNLSTINSDIDRIRILYKHQPNSLELPVMIQKICREAERRANQKVFDGYVDHNDSDYPYCYNAYIKNRNRYLELRDFALQVASENRSKNPAMWQYAASFLTLLDEKPQQAARYIAKAKKMKGTPFIKNNIQVLSIMIEAYNGKYDASFENRMLPQLQWLDRMIQDNLTEKIKEEYINDENSVFKNYSMYYYNDMMRKITLSVMAPAYQKQKQETKALLLAGMASERLRSLINYRQDKDKRWNPNWNIDFYTDLFVTMDTSSVESIIRYKHLLKMGSKNPFEMFLISKCYQNDDYYNEIIGTKYMRAEQFDKAVTYLSKVAAGYDSTLNIYPYFHHNPFQEPFLRRQLIKPASGYKLNFATRMLDYQRIMKIVCNPEIKADVTYQYVLGLMRATNDCWALLLYKKGYNYWNDKDDGFLVWGRALTDHSEQLMSEIIRLSSNPELKAKIIASDLWANGNDSYKYIWDNDIKEWKKTPNQKSRFHKNIQLLWNDYATTNFCWQLQSECDVFRSYLTNEE